MSPRAFLGLFLEGVRSNWWGLGCPFYCAQPSPTLLGLCLLVGWVLGFLSAVFCLVWISGPGASLLDLFRSSVTNPRKSWRLTCMSLTSLRQDGDVELRIELPEDLRVVVTCPARSAGLAAELLGHISLFQQRAGSPTERSFEVVSLLLVCWTPLLPPCLFLLIPCLGLLRPVAPFRGASKPVPPPSRGIPPGSVGRLCLVLIVSAVLGLQGSGPEQCRIRGSVALTEHRPSTLDQGFTLSFGQKAFQFPASSSHLPAAGSASGVDFEGVSKVAILVADVRSGGFLGVVPIGFIPKEVLAVGNAPSPPGQVGPYTVLVVPGVVMENGLLTPTGQEVPVLVVDFTEEVLERMRLPDQQEVVIFSYDADQQFSIPHPRVQEWVAGEGKAPVWAFTQRRVQMASKWISKRSCQRSKRRHHDHGAENPQCLVQSRIQGPQRSLRWPLWPVHWRSFSMSRWHAEAAGGVGRSTAGLGTESSSSQLIGASPSSCSSPAYLISIDGPSCLQPSSCPDRWHPANNGCSSIAGSVKIAFGQTCSSWRIGGGEALCRPIYLQRSLGPGRLGAIHSTDSFGATISLPELGPAPGLERFGVHLQDSGGSRQSQASDGLSLPERDLLSLCPDLHGKEDVSNSPGRRFPTGDDGERGLRDKILGEIRWIWETPGVGMSATPSHDGVGLPANGELGRSSRCSRPPGGHARPGGVGLSKARGFSPLADQKWATVALAYVKELDLISSKRLELTSKPAAFGGGDRGGEPSAKAKPFPKKKGRGGKGGNAPQETEDA
eukprot:s154_g82.t1